MGFPSWGRRCELVIQSSQVAQDCTDFPVLVHEDSLPSEIFDADGSYPALNGGGDLRFSTDQAGDTQLPCEVESFVTDNDPANGKSAVWVKRTLSSAANTSIWVYYNKSGETQPAETDAYGKHAVWDSNYVMVQHMAETPPGTTYDSTSNSNDGTTSGMDSADQVSGQIDGALDFDGVDDYIDLGSISAVHPLNLAGSNLTISFWLNWDGFGDSFQRIIDKSNGGFGANGYAVYNENTDLTLAVDGINNIRTNSNPIVVDTWKHITVVYISNSNTGQVFSDGVEATYLSRAANIIPSDTTNMRIGTWNHATGREYNGALDEVRISNIARAANWNLTEYNNQYAPSTFIIEGTPETPGGTIYDETGRAVNIAAIETLSDIQAYQETLNETTAAGTTVTDLQAYLDTLHETCWALTSVSDTQNYKDALISEIATALSLVDAQIYKETLLTTIASILTGTDTLSSAEIEHLLTTIASGLTITDTQKYKDALSETIEVAANITDKQAYIDDLTTTITSSLLLADSQEYKEALSIIIGAIISGADTSTDSEALVEAIAVLITGIDKQAYKDSLHETIGTLVAGSEIQGYKDSLAIGIGSVTAITDKQAYMDTLATIIASVITATDILPGVTVAEIIRLSSVINRQMNLSSVLELE